MTLNDLLLAKHIDPKQVVVLRHRPREQALNRVLPEIAADRADLFNAYQRSQGDKLQTVFQKVQFVASFIRRAANRALFVGLYQVKGWTPMTPRACAALPENVELVQRGAGGFAGLRAQLLWFDLALRPEYAEWKGRLVVDWPPPGRSWWRRAHRNVMPVRAILEDSALHSPMPAWNQLTLNRDELLTLPNRWRDRMKDWRGIYFIFDSSDGKGYVGSAYGQENLLGRWTTYATGRHGGNKLLKPRDPKHFRFSILQLLPHDADTDDVLRLESSWKNRLHTRAPHGLNDN
jgi:hypothetical protein